MDTIQTDVSDHALTTAIRANLCAFFRYMGGSFPENYIENQKYARWHLPVAHPWFNGVLCSSLPEESDSCFIEDSIQYFRARNVRSFTWWMEPHLKCQDGEALLSPHGFRFFNDTPGMALDLQRMVRPAQEVEDLEVREVTDDASLRAWAHVFTTGYGLPAVWEPSVYDLEIRLGFNLPIRSFLGYWNGEPAATSTLFLGAGVAGIYNVATLPGARGKGIGGAMTHRPLLDARGMGYRIGILQSSEMGFGVYQKLGFRHLCQIEHFHLAFP